MEAWLIGWLVGLLVTSVGYNIHGGKIKKTLKSDIDELKRQVRETWAHGEKVRVQAIKDKAHYDLVLLHEQRAREALNASRVEVLTILEKLVYLSEGSYVKKEHLAQLLLLAGRKVIDDSTAEGGPISGHGDDGIEPEGEQAPNPGTSGVAQWSTEQPVGDLNR